MYLKSPAMGNNKCYWFYFINEKNSGKDLRCHDFWHIMVLCPFISLLLEKRKRCCFIHLKVTLWWLNWMFHMIGFGKMITLIALIGWGKNMVPAFPIIGKTSLDWSQTSWAQNLAPSSVKSSSTPQSIHFLGQFNLHRRVVITIKGSK